MKNLIMKLSVGTVMVMSVMLLLGFSAFAEVSLTQDQAVQADTIVESRTESVPVTSLFTTCIVNLHDEPSTDAQHIIKTIPRGTSVLIIGQNGNWSQVMIGSDTGYICSQYLATAEQWNAIKDVPYCEQIPLGIDVQQYLWQECQDLGVDYCFALAIIDRETGGKFNPNAVSSTSDYGLFQCNACWKSTFKKLGFIQDSMTELLNPYNSIHAGLYLLSQYYAEYGPTEPTAFKYNRGHASAKSSNGYSKDVVYNLYPKWKKIIADITSSQ